MEADTRNQPLHLGRYEVVRELGKGAMGIVYLAKDPLIGRLVALKTIRLASGVDDDEAREFQQRFVREAQAAGILNHPSIVTVHDIGEDTERGISFIAMEYVEGNNLKELLQQGRYLTFDQIAEMVAQVAEALDYAHSKGIVHRDVKPANIILCGETRAKITDFGIAKIVSGAANLTTTGQFLGTPNYMAPEQVRGAMIDGRSDLFSLGIVLYECLTHRKPFGGDSLTTISYKIVHEPFPPLREVDPAIPDGFDQIVTRCLEKDPANRYQRGRELAVDLRNALRDEKIVPLADPFMNDETFVAARDAQEKIPTIEIPFPDLEAVAEARSIAAEGRSTGSTRPGPKRQNRAEAAAAGVPTAGALTLLRRRVPAAVYFGVTLVLLTIVAASGFAIWQQRADVPAVDEKRETLVARQRTLRREADVLLQAGNVEGAYAKYSELRQIAPNSPSVAVALANLERIRMQNLTYRQRLAQSTEKLEEGRLLYEKKQYAKAIPLFEEAFHLNPSNTDAVNYLRMSREQLTLEQIKKGEMPLLAGQPSSMRPATAVDVEGVRPAGSAVLQTFFRSPVNDGYILVRVGGETLLHENLYEESRGLIRRKKPRTIDVTREISAGSRDVDIWVVIPSMRIQERKVLRQNFSAGGSHRLTVSMNPATKRFDYQIS